MPGEPSSAFEARNHEILRTKEKALQRFLDGLREKRLLNLIGKIFLFGSVARGTATSASDIDLLIFAAENPHKVSEECADVAFATAMETGESVEPLVYTLNDYRLAKTLAE